MDPILSVGVQHARNLAFCFCLIHHEVKDIFEEKLKQNPFIEGNHVPLGIAICKAEAITEHTPRSLDFLGKGRPLRKIHAVWVSKNSGIAFGGTGRADGKGNAHNPAEISGWAYRRTPSITPHTRGIKKHLP